jgi:hypothetical protein
MSATLKKYKRNATRKYGGNGNGNKNVTARNTLRKKNRGQKKKVGFSNDIKKNYIAPRENEEVNDRNRKRHGNSYRRGLGKTNYMEEYKERRGEMTQAERNAENKEERHIYAALRNTPDREMKRFEHRYGIIGY